MRANDVSEIDVTKMVFAQTGTGSSYVTNANVTNVKLYVNDSLVSTKNMST
jgi:hypothetical protein